jgi:hypothetical protein
MPNRKKKPGNKKQKKQNRVKSIKKEDKKSIENQTN